MDGGVGDMIFSKQSLNDAHVTEYFAITDKDFSTLSYYGSQIWVWLRPGGTSPDIIIEKGNARPGSLVGGSPGDFKIMAE